MSDSRPRRILISALAEIDGAPLVLQAVYYPTLLGAYARAVRGNATLVVAAPAQAADALRAKLAAEKCDDIVEVRVELPARQEGDLCFEIDQVFIPAALRAALAHGRLETPVWLIKESGDISRAAATLERHDMYVLARYLVIPVARRLARALLPTRISPNTITTWSCLCGVGAGIAPLFIGGLAGGALAALLIHLSITLDFTDGYLARLRGTDGSTGYWFDTMLDEVVKMSLFLGMTALMLRSGPGWGVAAGVVTLLLYHVLTCSHWITVSLESSGARGNLATSVPRWRSGFMGFMKRVYERLNYLDVHLYVIALAFLLQLEALLLALFAANYTFRFLRVIQLRLWARG